MPLVRTPSKQSNSTRRRSKRPSGAADNEDVIVLSSGDEGPAKKARTTPRNSPSKRQRGKTRAHATPTPFVATTDVVEISDDSDSERRTRKAPASGSGGDAETIAKLQQRLKTLQEDNSRILRDHKVLQKDMKEIGKAYAMSAAEVQKMKKQPCPPGKIQFDASEIEEAITCEICSLKLWTPSSLACGHTFCQKCLTDWFSTTLTKFMADHPHYNPNNPGGRPAVPANLLQAIHRLHEYPPHQQQMLLDQYAQYQHVPGAPAYTCPTCRVEVKARPLELYTLKALVHTLAAGMGESAPQEAARPAARRGAPPPPVDPWEGFFGKKKAGE
ncbi:hypothetical protein PLICRDRAFT_172182 [Plicaturopsis crispa FD-325 SS-3]|nr:hypothetical protein PLICRDRAFT_172182 [Plicaturopsis crispa FD-325 SS-3]